MRSVVVIPARFSSSRLPGKPLADIAGMSMIRRVYDRASKAKCPALVAVATDDDRIAAHVESFGGKALITSATHKSGTDRCAQAASLLKLQDEDVLVNLQGDEPFIDPLCVDVLCNAFVVPDVQIATLSFPVNSPEQLTDPSKPKVIINKNGEAIYFSRFPVPYLRDVADRQQWPHKHNFLKHIGIYAYKVGVLKTIAGLTPSPLELAESLEQLRWLENGLKIRVLPAPSESLSVDTPDDLEAARAMALKIK